MLVANGYAVWCEAIADTMADAVLTDMATSTLEDNKDIILQYYQEIGKDNPDSKKAMSLIVAYTMIFNEVVGTENWKVAENKWEHSDTDIGICAAHLWLGLLNEEITPRVEVIQDNDRAMWKFYL